MAKTFASEAAEAIRSAAIQTLGLYDYLCDYPVERIYRDDGQTAARHGSRDNPRAMIVER